MRWRSLIPSEHEEQKTVVQWTKTMAAVAPEASLLFAIPNGGMRPKRFAGLRKGKPVQYSPEAKRLQAEGVQPGMPDLMLPVARHGCYGLFIEMKRQGGQTTPDQELWHLLLRNQGYAVCICHSADEAIGVISGYLSQGIWNPYLNEKPKPAKFQYSRGEFRTA